MPEVEPTLENLLKLVGGYIKTVRTWIPEIVMIVDNEGKLKDKPLNPKATALITFDNYIVSDAVLIKEQGEKLVVLGKAPAKAIIKNAVERM